MGHWSLDVAKGVAVLTFDRPPANRMDLNSMSELAAHLEALAERTADARVVMLTGGIDGYFIAHADLDDVAQIGSESGAEDKQHAWDRAHNLLASIPQPTVAAIDGQAWGGGCETALACSMRIGSARAHMAQPEVALGIIPGAGGTQRLPRLVGQGIGIELCTTGRRVLADEALRIGLLNAVLPTEDFTSHAITWCSKIARNPAASVFAAKKAVVEGLNQPLAEALALESRMFVAISSSEEARSRIARVSRRWPGGRQAST